MTRVLPYGKRAVLVDLDNAADVVGLHAALTAESPDGMVELVPAARTLLVRFDPARTDSSRITDLVLGLPLDRVSVTHQGKRVDIPVSYTGEDFADVARACELSIDEVVARHQANTYVAAFGGFAPGFAYLTGLDSALHVPRRATPRTKVPAGSVAIAGEYTAIYPHASPGGWQLIGHTDLPVWDVHRARPHLLPPGTEVRFVAA
jgi:KipI family sensor histidine kinase inhibitor